MHPKTVEEQSEVLHRAIAIFERKNRIRDDLWRESGPERNIDMAKQKLARLSVNLSLGSDGKMPFDLEEFVDDALDAINFVVFVVRAVEERAQQ